MQLRKLLNGLKAAYRGSNVARRMQYFDGWTANAYIAGGKTEIFTPLYCFLARKPL